MSYSHTEILDRDYFEKQYVFQAVHPALKDVAEFYWQLDLRDSSFGNDDFAEHIFASLHTSIVFNLGSSGFGIGHTGQQTAVKQSVIIGHHTHTLQYHHYAGNFLFGIKLKPAGINRLFGFSSAALNNHFTETIDLFKNDFVEEQLFHCGSASQRADLLDRLLMHKMNSVDNDYKSLYVHKALSELAGKQVTSVEKLASQMHLTKRSLERYFRDEIGLTPKTCLSIMRFRSALKQYLEAGTRADYEAFGYHDFSHFMKDYRRFATL